MRIFLAGATGIIGRRIVPLLREAGHDVAGMTRSQANVTMLRALGAEPVVCDAFDASAVHDAVTGFAPDLVMDQLTDLPDDAARVHELGGANARIRRLGTRALLTAAAASRVERFFVQSVAWTIPGDGGEAVAEMEELVLGVDGVVLRYGRFHGPGTYFPTEAPRPPCVHIDTAAVRTVALLDHASGIVTITDD